MTDDRDLNMSIARQLGEINRETGEFVAGILCDTISRGKQITFATKLSDLALTIKERATGEANLGSLIEGEIVDDRSTSAGGLADSSGS